MSIVCIRLLLHRPGSGAALPDRPYISVGWTSCAALYDLIAILCELFGDRVNGDRVAAFLLIENEDDDSSDEDDEEDVDDKFLISTFENKKSTSTKN